MLSGLNAGAYAAVNRLIAFGPCNVTVTQDGLLFAHVAIRYDSNGRGIVSNCGFGEAITFCTPHALATVSRNRRPACSPDAVVTPGDPGGVVPSSALVIE